ncbi:hypothetical protein [Paraliomyxa miuraensis]|uniref:hypothetical protein n=1 Tax=Paraliomyxa miuraensis TaxID=376150 RepID=UPI002258BF3A|nr:hypothetical protein [Paraliomyxa miuraensis]MCX4247221.1 hypothetical protein [Paraliomyxa miuraensis]
MNFVGHAMAAGWERDAPGFVLGAMLPDFVRMCGARLGPILDPELADGVACHHRIDELFHGAETFVALCTRARTELQALGLARGPAMAAAHVGVELLLDGCWLEDPRVDAAYLRAVEHGTTLPEHAVTWPDPSHARRVTMLCAYLRDAGSPRAYCDPTEVGRRIVRILSRRPRLAPAPGDEDRLIEWARTTRPTVIDAAPHLRASLARASPRAELADLDREPDARRLPIGGRR